MIRVLQVIGNMDIGGMESMLMNYYRAINRDKVQFDFLIFNTGKCFYETEIKKLGGKIFKITPRKSNPLKNRRELKSFFNTHHYDIVEIHQGITYLLPLKLAKKAHIKNIIAHNHGVDGKYKKGLYNFLRKNFILPYINRTANHFFACSNLILEDLFTEQTIKDKRYAIINNAISIEHYIYNKEKRQKIRNELNIKDHIKVIGHVGRFSYPKNQEFIMEIAKELPEYVFVLVGGGDSQKLKELNLPNVIFYGVSDDVASLMQAFDVFILPSRWEGLPLVSIEAQAAGLPVLLSSNITKEAAVTSQVTFLPLKLNRWVKTIQSTINSSNRNNKDALRSIALHGYDCKTEAQKLENIYINMMDGE